MNLEVKQTMGKNLDNAKVIHDEKYKKNVTIPQSREITGAQETTDNLDKHNNMASEMEKNRIISIVVRE